MIQNFLVCDHTKEGDNFFETHLHECYEINFMLSDDITVISNNAAYLSLCGDLFVFPPFCFHKIISDGNVFRRFVLFFDKNEIIQNAPVLKTFFEPLKSDRTLIIHPENTEKMTELFKSAILPEVPDSTTDFKIISAFGNILLYINESINGGKHITPYTPHIQSESLFLKIIKYINDNYSEDITTKKIADEFLISSATLWRIMKNNLGISAKEYIIKTRIYYASKYLEKGYSVTETSNLCGFSSYAHFIRTFTSSVGISPLKYAHTHRI